MEVEIGFLVGITLIGFITYRIVFATKVPNILSRWHGYFDNMQFSAKEFYKHVEEEVTKKKIPGVSITRVSLAEGGIIDHKREYLRISRSGYTFDICAAPFGTDYFVSWWYGELYSFWRRILQGKKKTYYRLDTESMFMEGIKQCVNTAIDRMTNSKSSRTLSDIGTTAEKVAAQ